MRSLWIFLRRVRAMFRARQLDSDLREEIAGHLEEVTEDYLRQGLSATDARRAALRNFGGVALAEDAYRDVRSFAWLDHLRMDVRHAARTLRRSAGFSMVVLTVLAIGIGSITSVFALLKTIVLQPLPFVQSDQLVVVRHSAPGVGLKEAGLSSGLFFHYGEHARSMESVGVYTERVLNLRMPEAGTERVYVVSAGTALLRVLGAKPALGRLFTEEDGRPGFMNLRWTIPVLLTHDFWVDRFGADPNVIGRILTINENPREVVGVLAEGFEFPGPGTQIWMLSEVPRNTSSAFARFNLNAVARLRPGVTAAAAQAELVRILPGIEGKYADATPERMAEVQLSPVVIPLKSAVISDVAPVIWTLFGGMAFLLLIACANAGGLFLVRAEYRHREIAVRQALGAGGHHVARLFFTEALMLTTAAAALGLLLAKGLLLGVMALTPVQLPRAAEIQLDSVSVAFAAAVAFAMAAFYGALSVRRQSRPLTMSLRSDRQWASERPARHWVPDPFIVLQVSLALTLMAGSVLMLKTYRNLSQNELGFSPGSVLTVEVGLPGQKASQHARIYRELVESVGRLRGVEHASAASFVPLTGSEHVFPVVAGETPVLFKFFVPGYFGTMQTPVVEGQSLAAGEPATAPYPVLVSATLARRLYPSERAVGKAVRRLNEDGSIVDMRNRPVPAFTIVGVVGDVRETTLRDGPAEIVYIPVVEPSVELSIVPTNMSLVIRTAVPSLTLAAAVRKTIEGVDPGLSVGRIRSMDAIVRAARAKEAFVGVLLLLTAAVSVFLGIVGIYGSVAHVVRRRTREIGIRIALGARRAEVVRMVAAGSMRAALAGAALGLVVAFPATRMLNSLLFGVEPHDPVTFLLVTGGLLSAAIAAALVAAWGAARVTPLLALRSD